MTFKTIKEQEREAYITGHTFMADLLANTTDEHESNDELEALREDLETAHSEIEDLQADNALLRDELAETEKLRAELQAELDAK